MLINTTTRSVGRPLFWSLPPDLDLQATGATTRSPHLCRADNLNRKWPSYTNSNSSSNITNNNSSNGMEAQRLKHRKVESLHHQLTARRRLSSSRNRLTCNNKRRLSLSLNSSSLCNRLLRSTNRMRMHQLLLRRSKAATTTTSQHPHTSRSTLLLLNPTAMPTGQAVTGL